MKERVWVVEPGHPIADGLGPWFEIPHEEMYGERFDIPEPDLFGRVLNQITDIVPSWGLNPDIRIHLCEFDNGRDVFCCLFDLVEMCFGPWIFILSFQQFNVSQ